MGLETTSIEGLWFHKPKVFKDERGEFFESFKTQEISHFGFDFDLAQVNNSVSKKGTLRGIHFKQYPPGQAKFVTVHRGSIIDVVIDLRRSSETFGKWQSFELNRQNHHSLLIGYGLGHAFLALEDDTVVSYLCDSVFEPDLEHSIDPLSAGIDWKSIAGDSQMEEMLISPKDKAAIKLEQAGDLLFD